MSIQCLRGLDGITYALMVLLFLALQPSAAQNELGHVELWCILPIVAIGWFSLRLPLRLSGVPTWQTGVLHLRCLAVAQTMLAPFIVWWFRFPSNRYLLANAIMAVSMGIIYLLYLNHLSHQIAKSLCRVRLQSAIAVGRYALIYGLLVPFAATLVSYAIDHVRTTPRSLGDIYTLIFLVPDWLWLIFLAPVMYAVASLLVLRTLLARTVDESTGEQTW